jgi:5'-nucleotidase
MNDINNVALVDMDGTLCDFHGQLQRDLDKVLGEDRQKISAKTLQEVEWLIRRDGGWYRNLKPLPLGFQIVDLLRSIGFRIMIMTKSSKESKNAWSEKAAWISEHLPDVDMMVTMDKGLVYGKVLVDDYPSHFLRWMEHRPRGKVVMPVQSWNKDVGSRPNLYAVSEKADLEAITPMLKAAFERGRTDERTG